MKRIVKNAKGFTLVELMIVVAIIGILAAIAIPQFAAYRTRSFNAAAISDLRNTVTAEAGLFTDVQSFGVTEADVAIASPQTYNGGAGGPGVLCVGPVTAGSFHALAITPNGAAAASGIRVGVSNNVALIANTDIVNATNPRAGSFVIVTKHTNGNTYFGQDSDVEAIYQVQDDQPTAIGRQLTTTDVPDSIQGADDFDGVTLIVTTKVWQAR